MEKNKRLFIKTNNNKKKITFAEYLSLKKKKVYSNLEGISSFKSEMPNYFIRQFGSIY